MSKRILITTIPHSGTNSLMSQLNVIRGRSTTTHEQHCCKEVLNMAKSGDYDVYTTWRSPLRVAATFGNRQKIFPKWASGFHLEVWSDWWKHWALIKPYATKIFEMDDLIAHLNNSSDKDRHGLHKAIDEEDWDTYYNIIPKDWITEAYKYVRETP